MSNDACRCSSAVAEVSGWLLALMGGRVTLPCRELNMLALLPADEYESLCAWCVFLDVGVCGPVGVSGWVGVSAWEWECECE